MAGFFFGGLSAIATPAAFVPAMRSHLCDQRTKPKQRIFAAVRQPLSICKQFSRSFCTFTTYD
jgi:hypothetical protein